MLTLVEKGAILTERPKMGLLRKMREEKFSSRFEKKQLTSAAPRGILIELSPFGRKRVHLEN